MSPEPQEAPGAEPAPLPAELALYDYELPPERIAQEPAARREDSRLLVLDRAQSAGSRCASGGFAVELPQRLRAGDLLVLNDVRVFPARLRWQRPQGGYGEVLLLSPEGGAPAVASTEPLAWEALARPARWLRKRMAEGQRRVRLGRSDAELELEAELERGRFRVRLWAQGKPLAPEAVIALCEAQGLVPLPPYIRRKAGATAQEAQDRERYQTVYAQAPWAVAAPTAGLHFSPELLARLAASGIEVARVTQQIGLGTFRPLSAENLSQGVLHEEWTRIEPEAGARILAARREGRRLVAVGTTSVRALESFALAGCPLPYQAPTRLFIRPGHRFALVDALVTNFHLPQSSLLMLVCAFAGRERVLSAYAQAIAEGFRFYSFGDAMLIV